MFIKVWANSVWSKCIIRSVARYGLIGVCMWLAYLTWTWSLKLSAKSCSLMNITCLTVLEMGLLTCPSGLYQDTVQEIVPYTGTRKCSGNSEISCSSTCTSEVSEMWPIKYLSKGRIHEFWSGPANAWLVYVAQISTSGLWSNPSYYKKRKQPKAHNSIRSSNGWNPMELTWLIQAYIYNKDVTHWRDMTQHRV